ncbi:hypothetical protein ANO11243_054960 [Dothideomycetidae sp. 11243]|nr:hypothetical protein ANO11243_054960 [fungal sp. No.11243]
MEGEEWREDEGRRLEKRGRSRRGGGRAFNQRHRAVRGSAVKVRGSSTNNLTPPENARNGRSWAAAQARHPPSGTALPALRGSHTGSIAFWHSTAVRAIVAAAKPAVNRPQSYWPQNREPTRVKQGLWHVGFHPDHNSVHCSIRPPSLQCSVYRDAVLLPVWGKTQLDTMPTSRGRAILFFHHVIGTLESSSQRLKE